jgi:hypothetical protein
MFGRVKKWLGFDSVKIKLKPLEAYPRNIETINGELELSCKASALVTYVKIKFIERYTRGRGESQKIDEYVLGEWTSDEDIEIEENNPTVLFFKLPFSFQHSPMEKLEHSNVFGKGIAGIFKMMKGAKSDYRLEAEVLVEGNKTNPTDKSKILFV